jgi:hypothetical protein
MAYEDPNDPMFGRSGTKAMSEPDVGRDGLQDAENLASKKRQQKSREEGRRRRELRKLKREKEQALRGAGSGFERRLIQDFYEKQQQGLITDISTEDVEQDDNLQGSNSRVGDDSIDTVDEPVISNTITLDVVLSDNTAGTQEFFIP